MYAFFVFTVYFHSWFLYLVLIVCISNAICNPNSIPNNKNVISLCVIYPYSILCYILVSRFFNLKTTHFDIEIHNLILNYKVLLFFLSYYFYLVFTYLTHVIYERESAFPNSLCIIFYLLLLNFNCWFYNSSITCKLVIWVINHNTIFNY